MRHHYYSRHRYGYYRPYYGTTVYIDLVSLCRAIGKACRWAYRTLLKLAGRPQAKPASRRKHRRH